MMLFIYFNHRYEATHVNYMPVANEL